MRVGLSIRQPWIELILRGEKTLEVRSRRTHYRGDLLLHAARKVEAELCRARGIEPDLVVRGALVGSCKLNDCFEFDSVTWETLRPWHLNPGPLEGPRFAWVITDPVRIDPIPYKGKLGLMRVALESHKNM